ncbi:dipeptide ABC transporter glycylmethionine-binding lipoprotein [Staphylococcus epidermidis]|jgi:ABC transporter, substrate-binding protein|uniref:dipeptide ABC transporter glycylmethionine-binding lipoprotein n=1 Tax=Staphylococcus epidermidis TaxID=1282 RepID=UPI00024323A8|nr:dipeptide ABC transporter glycylmethionine-binding lipoprotein [Staphylococcus epidermidis]MBA9873897.1 MetQ/NlpA family ABC transporter substrate-binding protein [Ralstonia insidiosa]EHM69954.1 NLPA lipoprotein [Staphylococcus epidermidis VCU071]KAB2191865.1 dipeptide ABC transporter glycylmethionine-binding lipoprotein [Staphylococcus epidermidis]MBC3169001.1 dipeptide ABC transporter glycylmethionine-binding lipoprotein [Staphylococcus epidermidis]MBE0334421.1 dipeptide ABC transporter g
MKKILSFLIVTILVLSACGGNNGKKVTIGVASNDTKAWEKVKELAKKDNIDLEIKHFSDYNVPNKALSDGDIDLNAFQHFAFLDQYKKAHKDTNIEALSTTVLAPLGIYSDKVKNIKDVKKGAQVAIPNDVSNQARALKLLESAGLIKLKKNFGLNGTTKDIESNPKDLKIKAVDAQQTARALSDVDISVINNGVATKAAKDAKKDPIYLEKASSDAVKPYINVVAVNSKDKDNKTYKKIIELYHSKEAQKALKEDTKDGEKPVDLSKKEIEEIENELAKK